MLQRLEVVPTGGLRPRPGDAALIPSVKIFRADFAGFADDLVEVALMGPERVDVPLVDLLTGVLSDGLDALGGQGLRTALDGVTDRTAQTDAVSDRPVIYARSVRNELLDGENLCSDELDIRDLEPGPAIWPVCDTDLPIVGSDDLFDDTQSEPSSFR
ncbi:hypothetical protein SAMN04487946_11412 [Halobellus clavatus]|uniref:Uncharacterized protein n=1 Tax=Halobellus clavatus TaxID=660517 RepID=A0A1H3JJJ3_9EURY|nr:hypothetical protein SAMN04487946_11412 [Halobellus clavatus]